MKRDKRLGKQTVTMLDGRELSTNALQFAFTSQMHHTFVRLCLIRNYEFNRRHGYFKRLGAAL